MNFVNALTWITVIYVAYYGIIILCDAIMKRGVKEVTGVQDFIVIRPDDSPTQIQDESFAVSAVVDRPDEILSEDENEGSSSFAEKKN
ncbi:MAG: hypothetical protein LBC19_05840 [Tannerella sp.]|jgi:hypothetical protein|nr:hypothetical protein [Tannerella sp.]